MEKSIKGTRTEQNLLKSFAGESQARSRYTFFASKAKKEGFEQIAAVFAETAEQEKEHAERFFKFLEGGMVEITASYPAGIIGTTADNLAAAAAGEKSKGEALVNTMDNKLAELESKLKVIPKDKEKVVMAFSFIGAIGRKDNLLDDIFSYAHVRNGAAEAGLDQGSNALSKERIIEIDPDVFLLPTWNFDSNNDVQKYAQQVATDPAFKNIKAIKNNRLEFVSDRYRYVASQHVTDSIEAVAKVVYPELFAKGE